MRFITKVLLCVYRQFSKIRSHIMPLEQLVLRLAHLTVTVLSPITQPDYYIMYCKEQNKELNVCENRLISVS